MPRENHASSSLIEIFEDAFDFDIAAPHFDLEKLASQSLDERRLRLDEIKDEQRYLTPEIETLVSTRRRVENERAKLSGVLLLIDHGCPARPRDYGFGRSSLDALEDQAERLREVSEANRKLAARLHRLGSERMALGLSMFFDQSMLLPPERKQVLDDKIRAWRGFSKLGQTFLEIRIELAIAATAMQYEDRHREWIETMVEYPVQRGRALVHKVQTALCQAPYPFESRTRQTIDDWAIARGAVPKRLTDLRDAPKEIERYRHLMTRLHQRVYSHLCAFSYNAEQFTQTLAPVERTEVCDADFDLIITD